MELPSATFELADGTQVEVRPLVAEDAPLLVEAFDNLSSGSRLSRFLTGIDRLSPAQVEYLTDVDQWDHIAIGATIGGSPVAVARCVRDTPGSTTAELAVTVVDQWQQRGLGYLMVQLISTLAAEAGIARFTFAVMATNTAVMHMLEAAGAEWEPLEGPTLLGSALVRRSAVPGVDQLVVLFSSWPRLNPPQVRGRAQPS
jgi:RimJ/RimL family protein N-acetyltransferase